MSNGRRMRLGSLAMSLMASLPRRGMLFHLVLAVELVTAVEKFLVVAVANQFVEFRLRQELFPRSRESNVIFSSSKRPLALRQVVQAGF